MLAQHDFFKNITFASTSSTISRIPLPDLIYSESILFETVDLTGFGLLFLHVGLFHTLTWTPIDGPNSIAAPVSEPLLGSVVSSCLEAPEFFQVSDESGCASVDHESSLQLHRNTSCKLHICLVLISNIVHCNALSCSFDDLVATTCCCLTSIHALLILEMYGYGFRPQRCALWDQQEALAIAGPPKETLSPEHFKCLVMSGCEYQIPVQKTTYFWLQLIAFLEVRLFIFNIDFAAYWMDCRPVFVRNLGSICLFYLVYILGTVCKEHRNKMIWGAPTCQNLERAASSLVDGAQHTGAYRGTWRLLNCQKPSWLRSNEPNPWMRDPGSNNDIHNTVSTNSAKRYEIRTAHHSSTNLDILGQRCSGLRSFSQPHNAFTTLYFLAAKFSYIFAG